MPQTINQRKQTYFDLSSKLAQIDTANLIAQLDNSKPFTGWGRNQTIEIDGSKLFVKRVPVTTIEQENMFLTANMHNLPTSYNYGIGSVGLGVFRELVAHIKTTNWVLGGEHENFPLLYHYRFVPFSGKRAEVNQAEHDEYIAYWGGNENIDQYMVERRNASVELLLFLEYIPDVLHGWLLENLEQLPKTLGQMETTIDFLHEKRILHFDAHYWNFLTDGERIYLTDFGLVLDRNFALNEAEQAFFEANTFYDYGEFVSNQAMLGMSHYRQLPDAEKQRFNERFDIPAEGDQFQALFQTFSNKFDEIHASGLISMNEIHLQCLTRHEEIIQLMAKFFGAMNANPQKDTPFPNEELARLLAETDFANIS